jgi:hypothetical protein
MYIMKATYINYIIKEKKENFHVLALYFSR